MNCTLTWGPMLEAQTLRIPDTKLPRAPPAGALATTLAQAILP